MTAITKTERKQRIRYVKAGMWNDVVIDFTDGARYIAKSQITPTGELWCLVGGSTSRDQTVKIFDLADVLRVHR